MQTRALLLCVLATLALAQAYTVVCPIDVEITGPNTDGYENCCCVNSVRISGNALIHTINFPSISIVFGDVIIENNPNLETIPWSVDSIGGSLAIQNNAYLYGFPALLAHVDGGITITGNDQLSTVTMNWLWGTNSLNVQSNSHLRVLEAPLLTSTQYALTIQNNPLLTTLTLPAYSYADSVIFSGNGLSQLTLPALTQTENGISITDNANLQYVELEHLVTSYGPIDISGNYNSNPMSLIVVKDLDYFSSWNSQAVSYLISCNSYLQLNYGAYCPTAQAVTPKLTSYPAIQEKTKKTKKDFFEAKLKLAAKLNKPK